MLNQILSVSKAGSAAEAYHVEVIQADQPTVEPLPQTEAPNSFGAVFCIASLAAERNDDAGMSHYVDFFGKGKANRTGMCSDGTLLC